MAAACLETQSLWVEIPVASAQPDKQKQENFDEPRMNTRGKCVSICISYFWPAYNCLTKATYREKVYVVTVWDYNPLW